MNFAYLIMAHDNPGQLVKLLHLLDHPENEIFLHIDKKSSVLSSDTFLTNEGGSCIFTVNMMSTGETKVRQNANSFF